MYPWRETAISHEPDSLVEVMIRSRVLPSPVTNHLRLFLLGSAELEAGVGEGPRERASREPLKFALAASTAFQMGSQRRLLGLSECTVEQTSKLGRRRAVGRCHRVAPNPNPKR